MRGLRRTSIHWNRWYWGVTEMMTDDWNLKVRNVLIACFVLSRRGRLAGFCSSSCSSGCGSAWLLFDFISTCFTSLISRFSFLSQKVGITYIPQRGGWKCSYVRWRHRPGLVLCEEVQAICCVDARVQAESRARTDAAGQGYTRTRTAGPHCLWDLPTTVFRRYRSSTLHLIAVLFKQY